MHDYCIKKPSHQKDPVVVLHKRDASAFTDTLGGGTYASSHIPQVFRQRGLFTLKNTIARWKLSLSLLQKKEIIHAILILNAGVGDIAQWHKPGNHKVLSLTPATKNKYINKQKNKPKCSVHYNVKITLCSFLTYHFFSLEVGIGFIDGCIIVGSISATYFP